MAIFNINIGRSFTAPTVDNNNSDLSSNKYKFKLIDLTNNYLDAENDPYMDIIIKSLPGAGVLKYNNREVIVNQRFSVYDIELLSFYLPDNYTIIDNILYRFDNSLDTIILQYEAADYYLSDTSNGVLSFTKEGQTYIVKTVEGEEISNNALSFKFSVVEDSSENLESNIATFSFNPIGNINTEEPYVNQPPTVGDVIFNTSHNQPVTLLINNILDTYSDVEGDKPKNIKIVNLPSEGTLYIDEKIVNAGDIVDITNLEYKPSSNALTYTVNIDYQISDNGSNTFSNTGTITVNVEEKIANSPTVDDNSGILDSKIFTFGESSFTKNFLDGDGDSYETVKIKSLPTVPKLQYLGIDTKVGDTFDAVNSSGLKFILSDRYAIYNGVLYDFNNSITTIVNNYNDIGYKLTSNTNGILVFTDLENPNDEIRITGRTINSSDLCFDFTTSDNSNLKLESNVASFCLTPQGNINVKERYVNNPPTVGDNTLTTRYDVTLPLTYNDFIDDTDPRFSDPEGDAPYELKVLTLPINGVLELNGNPVTVNDILRFGTDITNDDNTTLFKYIPDSSKINITGVKFEFAVSDSGTKQFVQ